MSQKGLAPILIIILVAIIAVGGYLLYQKQMKPVVMPQPVTQSSPSPITTPVASNSAEAADWKTYTNSKYGFTFSYRPDLTIEEKEEQIRLIYRGALDPYDKLFYTTIRILDNPYNYTPVEFAEKELCKNALKVPKEGIDYTEGCKKLIRDNVSSYENNGIKGIRTLYNLFENPNYTIVFSYENKMIIINSTGETGGGPTELGKQTIDRILSTFKFTQ